MSTAPNQPWASSCHPTTAWRGLKKTPVLIDSSVSGAYAGANLEGSRISTDDQTIGDLYRSSATLQSIPGGQVTPPGSAQCLLAALNEITAKQELNLQIEYSEYGGADRDRTGGLLVANEAASHRVGRGFNRLAACLFHYCSNKSRARRVCLTNLTA
jgi:hypothetical protein